MLTAYHRYQPALRAILTRLLPNPCALCAQLQAELVCQACQQDYLCDSQPRCRQCALVLADGESATHCGSCLQHAPDFERTIAVCDYAPPCDQLVLALKFAHKLPLANLFASLLRDRMLHDAPQALPDMLLPVPLGSSRLAQRGFNQAHEMARVLARLSGIPARADILVRQRETAQQSGLHPDQRQKNMRRAFALRPEHSLLVADRHIAVIDDVMTTGITLQEIASVLKNHGAARVTNYVFARTPLH
jgi:ComF family protein